MPVLGIRQREGKLVFARVGRTGERRHHATVKTHDGGTDSPIIKDMRHERYGYGRQVTFQSFRLPIADDLNKPLVLALLQRFCKFLKLFLGKILVA